MLRGRISDSAGVVLGDHGGVSCVLRCDSSSGLIVGFGLSRRRGSGCIQGSLVGRHLSRVCISGRLVGGCLRCCGFLL
jgi:hypothetical protein